MQGIDQTCPIFSGRKYQYILPRSNNGNKCYFFLHISDTFYIQYQTRPNVCECDRFRIEISDIVSLVNLLLVFSLSVVYLSAVFCLDRHLLVFCLLVLCQSSVCLLSFFFQLNQLILKLVLDSWSQDLS